MATLNVTKENAEKLIAGNGIVFLDFWASWCGPCRKFGPIFDKCADKHPDLVFGKVNTEEEQELSASFGIRSIPTLMAFRDGVLVFQQAGALPEELMERLIAEVRAIDMAKLREEFERQSRAKNLE